MVRLGLHILAASYNTLDAERLRNAHSPRYTIRTTWPQIILEFGDLVSGQAVNGRCHYTADECRRANEICEIFAALPYPRDVKKMTLVRARSNRSWRELSTRFKIAPWPEARRQCEVLLLHLIQVAALDPYKARARGQRRVS
jgi:hypothetical protein